MGADVVAVVMAPITKCALQYFIFTIRERCLTFVGSTTTARSCCSGTSIMGIHVVILCMLLTTFDLLSVRITSLDTAGRREANDAALWPGHQVCEAEQCEGCARHGA